MDIQQLLQRLEDVIEAGRHMPFSRYTLIDEVRALELIDQLRISVPEEVEKAKRILARREEILNEAQDEGKRVVGHARERSTEIVEREVTVQVAQNRASNIIEEARREANQLMADADAYVMQILNKLEQGLARNLSVTRNGIQYMRRSAGTPPAVDNRGLAPAATATAMPKPPTTRRLRRETPTGDGPSPTRPARVENEKQMVEVHSNSNPPEELLRG